MRFKAMPRLAADPYPWHLSAALVCVGQASNPAALNGSCGQVPQGSLTPPNLGAISGLPKATGRGRPDWPKGPRFPSFLREPKPLDPTSPHIASERPYLLEHPPQRHVRLKTGAPTPVRGSRLSFDWIVPGFTAVCFWSARRRLIAALEGPVWTGLAPAYTGPD
jgi:hypothetical protein